MEENKEFKDLNVEEDGLDRKDDEENNLKDFIKPIKIASREEMYESIENDQKNFTDYFNKNKKTNTLIVTIFMAAIVIVIFALGSTGFYIPLIIGLIVAYIVVLTIFSNKTKKKLNADADRIVNDYFVKLDSYIFSDEHFSDVCFNVNAKLEEARIKELRIIKDINHIGGRDVIVGKFYDSPFIAGDLLIKTEEKNNNKTQQYIVFLGKMFLIEKPNIVQDGRIIIYLKGKGANGPTDIDDLTKVEGVLSEKYDVYASCDVNNVLNKDVIDVLEQFETNEMLIDMFITIDENRMSFGFSYSDAVMRVPLLDQFDAESIDQYKQDVERMIAIFGAIK